MSGRRNRRGRNRGRPINGILVLDKPQGLSSNEALQRVKRLFNARKAGHTGSLDPLATGVLPLCFGEATKLSQFLLDSDKRYQVLIQLGERTDTGDAEGKIISGSKMVDETGTAQSSETQSSETQSSEIGEASEISIDQLENALATFVGTIEQVPPMYSAIKQQGVPLYKLAREGKEVERASREVTIHNIDLLRFDAWEVELDVSCTKGTYVRTLADDLGELLGCGAHVKELRRLQAGSFDEASCVSLERLEEVRQSSDKDDYSGIDKFLQPMDQAVADLPEVKLPDVTAGWIKQGQPVLVRHLPEEGLVRLYQDDVFIGIGSILDDGRVAPRRMIADQ
ncbi:MAG: tRNA pseudouridine(55) synthase TruB [Gammaproteobacteria bacterium]|nr:tRNA pseudouridine(55) synthase TruB [Gammaproteobacteria bacterium]